MPQRLGCSNPEMSERVLLHPSPKEKRFPRLRLSPWLTKGNNWGERWEKEKDEEELKKGSDNPPSEQIQPIAPLPSLSTLANGVGGKSLLEQAGDIAPISENSVWNENYY